MKNLSKLASQLLALAAQQGEPVTICLGHKNITMLHEIDGSARQHLDVLDKLITK